VTHKLSRILWAAAIILTALPLAQAQVFTIAGTFGASGGVGSAPLARDAAGNLYGAGFGEILKMDPTGKVTTLYTFKGAPDGYGGVQVVLDPDGNLYGTTQYGGTGTCSNGAYPGCGTVFKLAATGEETILHSFTGSPDGSWPNGLIRDAKGNLYGTTYLGGSGSGTCFSTGCGTVYKIDPAGKETVLFRFDDGADGGLPLANLLLADGALYGTTAAGGTGPCKNSYNPIVGCGTIFQLVGRKETVLHSFQGPDGSWPESNVVRDSTGNFYATAVQGGLFNTNCDFGCGTVIKLEPSGTETILHAFEDQNDGESPTGVVIDSEGNLYGSGGGLGTVAGTVFEIDANDKFTILHAFQGQGAGEPGDLILDDQGNLYGSGSWMIFRITP
jgi:uncharacterized repeat protein (TIGR03803 family)